MEINIQLIFYLIIFNIILFQFNQLIAKKLKLFDKPDFKRKIHKSFVPITGGIFIFINFLLLSLIFNISYFENLNLSFNNKRELTAIIFMVSMLFFLGLYDDKYDVKPFTKLFLLIFVVLISILIDENLIISELKFYLFKEKFNLSKLSIPLTILFILLFLNALNMFDGIDMQVSIYFLIILIFFTIKFNILYLLYFSPVIILSCIYNIKKKLFLGDSGTNVISIIISWIIIKNYNFNNLFFCEEIFLIMIIPGLDMFRLFCIRIINGKNPFKADKKHLHHLLLVKFSYLKTFIYIQSLILFPIIFYFFSQKIIHSIILSLLSYILSIVLFGNNKKQNYL